MPAIRVSNLGKKYIISHQQRQQYTALRDVIADRFRSIGRKLLRSDNSGSPSRDQTEEFWALKDVSFEVKQGERVGIIGRNGAGKSTLLKILSRITEPTTGRIEISGRVASLLEVGTGFHPELTGRENIYLNGAILGMSKHEIRSKFDEIVAFAEIEKFLDTPVKRYSSGMYVRLAFAVAAHLEPEILIVDEVLAVGDAQFQKKCMGKMEHVAKEGRTVLFVSHNMQAINSLCNKTILLRNGKIERQGSTQIVIEDYLMADIKDDGAWNNENVDARKDVSIISARIINPREKKSAIINYSDLFNIEIDYTINTNINNWTLFVRLTDTSGNPIFTSWDNDSLKDKDNTIGIKYRAVCSVPPCLLRPGKYLVSLGSYFLDDFSRIEFYEYVFSFNITNIGFNMKNERRAGVITPLLQWKSDAFSR